LLLLAAVELFVCPVPVGPALDLLVTKPEPEPVGYGAPLPLPLPVPVPVAPGPTGLPPDPDVVG
jgi:hypothetical protein